MFPLCVANSFILDFFYNFSDIFSLARIVFWERVLVACLHQKKTGSFSQSFEMAADSSLWFAVSPFEISNRAFQFVVDLTKDYLFVVLQIRQQMKRNGEKKLLVNFVSYIFSSSSMRLSVGRA